MGSIEPGGGAMQRLAIGLFITLSATPCFAGYRYQRVDYPGAAQTLLLGINDLGQYAGVFVDSAGAPHALFFDGRHLEALDPHGVIGTSVKSRAYGLNNLGEIVGSYQDAAGVLHGYLYQYGKVTQIDFPGGQPTEAYGINDLGVIIGVYYDSDGNSHGFALRHGVYRDAQLPGSISTIPLRINDRGDV